MIHRISLILLMALTALAATAQLTAEHAFATAPRSVFPLLDTNTRLDMLDYYRAGMKNESSNALGGTSAVLEASPASLKVKMSDASVAQLFLVPVSATDTVIGVIRTVATPGHDSSITLYGKRWEALPAQRQFSAPVLADWVTDRAHIADVETVVPFMLTGYTFNPADATLTLTNNLKGFLSADIYSMVAPYMRETLVYEWNGKTFRRK